MTQRGILEEHNQRQGDQKKRTDGGLNQGNVNRDFFKSEWEQYLRNNKPNFIMVHSLNDLMVVL